MSNRSKKTGIIVSHTHWDRAWYLPFQQFRHRMVRMIDRLIKLLNENPDYHSFTLDGQTILLDDYLEIKPYNDKVLKNLISSGKLIVGPWYILPDMFLVSGESVIRNMQIGIASSRKFGATMQEGYVPDPFGHFAQLPQVLKKFGINSFIFMRGLDEKGKAEAGSIFDWESPDGSRVLTTYLVDGYFNGASLGYPDQFGRFDGLEPDLNLAKERIKKAFDLLSQMQKESTFLINNGFDHMPEQPELPDIIREINSNGSGVYLKHGTFKDYFDEIREEGLPHSVIRGDLLGNVDHPILSSVFSTRVYLKQQNHRSQSLLEKYVEPLLLWARLNTNMPDSSDFMKYTWKLLLQNHPHDDICGCSTDGVHEDDEVRFRQVLELEQSILVEIMENMMKTGIKAPQVTGNNNSDVLVYNPHPWKQRVKATSRILFADPESENGLPLPEKVLKAVDAYGRELALDVTLTHEKTIRNNFLETSWGRRYDVCFEVDVPPMGYHIVHIYESNQEFIAGDEKGESLPVSYVKSGTELWTDGNTYHVAYQKLGYRFKDFVRFEYQYDNGDTYTFGPVPSRGTHWAKLISVKPAEDATNAIRLEHELTVAKGLISDEKTTIVIRTLVSLEPDGSASIEIGYQNTAEDGRLRVVLPIGFATSMAFADGHFRIAERVLGEIRTPESAPEKYRTYPGELDYPTMHMNDFVVFKSMEVHTWFASRGNHEFELLDKDCTEASVAITLHRAVGLLSTMNGRIRRVQAGPSIPVPGAQCLRQISAQVGFGLKSAHESAECVMSARSFSHPAWVREMPWLPHLKNGNTLDRRASIIKINNPNVALSSFRLHDDGISAVLRIYNLSGELEKASIILGTACSMFSTTDLHERWDDENAVPIDDDVLNLELEPFEIRTIMVRWN